MEGGLRTLVLDGKSGEEVFGLHVYRCVECGKRIETEGHISSCPHCRCKVLIHEKGERRKACSCGGSKCGTCGSCSCG
ncbi:hypothetical protein [Thermanaerovibrio velox]|uniref:hypothetical protein n=1 Tax=Thermanaerovibrio velox TaxID=108007 RepID=UPI0006822F6A|nr:hypothetical protein [Thermanaerovibrio velox]